MSTTMQCPTCGGRPLDGVCYDCGRIDHGEPPRTGMQLAMLGVWLVLLGFVLGIVGLAWPRRGGGRE